MTKRRQNKALKKTPWFRVGTPPVRDGVYECVYSGESVPERREWIHKSWRFPDSGFYCLFGKSPKDKWRGLTQPAE